MKSLIIILISITLLLFLILNGIKAKRKPASKLSIYEHPSNYVKPPIEVVLKSNSEKEKDREDIDFNKL